MMAILVAVVFWQIYTDMTEAGIASGGPFDNAAAYPKALAIILALLVAVRIILKLSSKETQEEMNSSPFSLSAIYRPLILLALFLLYLVGLKILGYHLATTPFLFVVLFLNGERKWVYMILFSLISSFTVAFAFEFLLNVVLPGGIFRLNIPW